MKVLMISTDRKIFESESEVRRRMTDYAGLFDELQIIVFSLKGKGLNKLRIANNCFVQGTNSLNPFVYVWDAWWMARAIIRNDSSWALTCQDPFETGLVGWLLKRSRGLRLNLQIHTDLMSPFFKKESIKNFLRAMIARWLLPQADSVRVVSQRIKDSLGSLKLRKEPVVLPIFVETKVDSPIKINLRERYSQFDFIILMASRLTREKNFSLALEAFSLATKNFDKKIGLVIVGSGSELRNINKTIRGLSLQDFVILESWTEDLSSYYRTANLFLLTSNYEGYGRTLVEAAQFGCPVLTTEVGLVGEVANNSNSLICPIGDKNCFAKKIIWAAEHRDELIGLSEGLKNDFLNKLVDKDSYLRAYKNSIYLG